MEPGIRTKIPIWHSLKTRATVFTLAIFVLGIWALSLFVSRSLQADMERLLGDQQLSVVTAVAKDVNDNLTERLQALETVARASAHLMENPAALQARLEQRPLMQLLFNGGIWVAGPDGTAIADVPLSANRLGINYMDRDFIAAPLKEGKSAIGRPVIGKQLKAPVFPIAVPIRDDQGKVIGVIVGVTNLGNPSFLDKITDNRYGQTGGYFLVAPQHQLFITATDRSRVMQPLPAPGLKTMHDRYMQGYEGYGVAVSSRGVLELSAAKAIPAAGWYAVAILPAQEAFAPIADMQKRLLWTTLLLTLLTGSLIWWILKRQLAPLFATADAMEALADSEQIPHPLPGTQRGEIGQLVTGFNRILQTWTRREVALKEGEKRYRTLLENLSSGVVVHRPDTSILLANAKAAALLGLTMEQLLGKVALDPAWCFLQDDGTPMEQSDYPVNRVLSTGELLQNHVVGVRHPDRAETTWVLCSAYPVCDDDGTILQVVVTFADITERKQGELALIASEERWKFAIEGAGDGLWDWNIQTGKAFYSPRYKTMLGFAEDEIGDTADEWTKRIHPDDAPGVYAALQPYMDGKPGSATVEFRMLCKDGRWQWTMGRGMVVERDADGKPMRMIGTNNDITERRQAQEKLLLAAGVFTHALEGILITAPNGSILDVNAAFTRITGFSREDAIGQNPKILSSGRQDPAFYAAMWDALTVQGHWSGEIWNRRKNGEVYAEMLTISAVRDEQGATQHFVALFSDITTLKEHQSQLEHIAHFDALTNLPNRLLLADRLQQAMAQAQRRSKQVVVAYLDLDGFKNVNDLHGHDVGDQLLVTLANTMKATLREGDTLARIGGDEFVAVLIDQDGIESCMPMLSRLLEAAAEPVTLGELVLQGSVSVGVTFYPQAQDIASDQLLRQADQAMYHAKLAGKNRYHVFDAEQDSSMRVHHESLERIRLALDRGEFLLHYQPKVNMRSGQVIGAEALIRWQHPEKGLLAPAAFLPVIEDHPLAVAMGEWVIEQAMTQMELWHGAGLDLPVSINIGARQLQRADFVERLQAILARHPQVHPGCIELEVLETSALADMAQVSQVIEDCAQMGVKFALDDFGTGYSSLTYLKRLRVALLKIDQSFVRDMLDDPDDLAILQGVIGLAAAFKREVIAEGVETVEHGTVLLQLGCELAQGYGIARPMPPEQLPAWAATWQPDAAWCELPWQGGGT